MHIKFSIQIKILQHINFQDQLDGLDVNLDDMQFLTPSTEQQLQDLSSSTSVDFEGFKDEVCARCVSVTRCVSNIQFDLNTRKNEIYVVTFAFMYLQLHKNTTKVNLGDFADELRNLSQTVPDANNRVRFTGSKLD